MNEEIIKKLKQYQKICNQAIEKARLEKIEGAINWSDLKCFDVKLAIDLDGVECYQFFIDEAGPVNEDFKEFIGQQILMELPEYTYIEVFTEW